ncbi:inhibitor of apoptosis-promoting Bax1-domain-containing protein [Scheffersomyces amazonensis]|uniref:inhibitor of apoptosis-promoting Bax1-domain-containing protein n=1 Tax=Scheffersomyces amazonensis TaxID=1078765 RepID=UPI00315D1778
MSTHKDPLGDYAAAPSNPPPPAYNEDNNGLFTDNSATTGGSNVPTNPYDDDTQARSFGDNIPDDFKYSVNVASCELPLRQLFIRKVYSLLGVQLFATLLVGFVIRSSSSIQSWCLNNLWVWYVSLFLSFGFLFGCYFKARSYPINLVLLGGFTFCEAYGIGLATSLIESDVVINAVLLTFIIFIGLTLFTFQTKYDFTAWESYAGLGVWILFGWGFLMMFFPNQSSFVENLYGLIGSLIFCVYIIIDTQKIMTVNHLDDEIISCIQLYLDIINLFLFILRILNNNRND